MINLEKVFSSHNINIKILIFIYLFSFIPVYGGAFLILRSVLKNVSLGNLLKLNFNGVNFKNKEAAFGLMIFIAGWFLPYLYILFLGKNLSGIAYLMVVFVGLFSLFILFKNFFSFKIVEDNFKYKIERLNIINNKNLQNELWEIYSSSFIGTNKMAPCQQSIKNLVDFKKEMLENSVKKYLLYNRSDELIGLGLITNNFSNCTWISDSFFQENYYKYYINNKLYYFMGVAIKEFYRRKGLAVKILESIIEDLPNDAAMGFDHSQKANRFIPYFINVVKQRKVLKRKFIDKQAYYLVTKKDNNL